MTWLTRIRLGLSVLGVLVWAWGYRADDANVRWVGIGLLAAVVILRFVKRGRDSDTPAT